MAQFIAPTNPPVGSVCRRILIPNDPYIIAAVNGVLSYLWNAERWQQLDPSGPTTDDIADLMSAMYASYLEDECDTGGGCDVEFQLVGGDLQWRPDAESAWISLGNVTGPQGEQGIQGPPGTGPTFVAAKYQQSVGQNLPNMTTTVINFATKLWDTHNAVTTGANWIFTVPSGLAGYYLVNVSTSIGQYSGWATNEGIDLYLRKNGTEDTKLDVKNNLGAGSIKLQGSTVLKCNDGDTIQATMYHNNGATIQTSQGSPQWLYIDISRIANL